MKKVAAVSAVSVICLLMCFGGTDEASISFNFDQVDIRSFVKAVGEITGKKFVVAGDVTGKITVVSPNISRAEVYPLFMSILESAGCSVVEEGGISRIVVLQARATPLGSVVGEGKTVPPSGIVTRIIRLKNASATELKKALEAQIGGGKQGAIAALEETNHLIITDTAENIRKVEKIIEEIDQPGTARVTEVVALQFASAQALADQLNAAVAEGVSRGEAMKNRLPQVPGSPDAMKRTVGVVAAPHSNGLILIGSTSQIEELKKLISKMDVDTPSGRGRLNAIFLKYTQAEDAAKSINALLSRQPSSKTAGVPSVSAPAPVSRDIGIEAMSANNALLVDAMPGDYEVVKKLVEQLDLAPQQVHISVIIAERTSEEGLDFGVQFAAVDMPSKAGENGAIGGLSLENRTDSILDKVQKGIIPRGLSVGIANSARVDASGKVTANIPGFINIDALKKDGKIIIKASPSLVAQNNMEAFVSIVDQIPVKKSVISGGSGTARDVIQNIDRVDVGIKLKLTPHVIPGGVIRMVLNPSIEAVIDPGPAGEYTPTIARREVSTTVTVPDGKVIVIAGLTREDKTLIKKRIPILGAIPLIGLLFGSTSESTKLTDMYIFVTPRIVTDIATAEGIVKDLEKKTGLGPNENK